MEEAKLAGTEAEDELWSRVEKDIATQDARVKTLDEEYRKRRSGADRSYNQDLREVQKQQQVVH